MLKAIYYLAVAISTVNCAPRIIYNAQTVIHENSCAARKTPGLICETCDRMALCVQINDRWQTYPVEPCNTEIGLYCNIHEGNCSSSPGPCNRLGYEGNFACTSDGIFPDPYDCQKYHMCYHAQSDQNSRLPIAGTANCNSDNAYTAASSDCSAKISDNVCTERQYNCQSPGDSSSWPGNPNIFYICQPEDRDGVRFLYPTLYRCAPHEIYNGINCVSGTNNSIVTTTIYAESSEGETSSSAPDLLSCQQSGLRIDPIDCHSYYYCPNNNGPSIRYTCQNKTYFDELKSSCTVGDCIDK